MEHTGKGGDEVGDNVACPHRSCAQRGGRGLASPSSTLKRFAVSVASAAVVRAAMAAAAEPPSTATVTSLHAVIARCVRRDPLSPRPDETQPRQPEPPGARTAEFASEHFDRSTIGHEGIRNMHMCMS